MYICFIYERSTQMNSQERKEYKKAWYEAHKEQLKAKQKAYYQAHKEEKKAKQKAYYKSHTEEHKARVKTWKESHKEELNAYARNYIKNDLNSHGQTKDSIRRKSRYYLEKYGTKIPGYQIHHCCTYDDPYKFIYCSKEMHRLIHAYLKQHNIDADSEHYKYIKHLLDDSVVKYNIHD